MYLPSIFYLGGGGGGGGGGVRNSKDFMNEIKVLYFMLSIKFTLCSRQKELVCTSCIACMFEIEV